MIAGQFDRKRPFYLEVPNRDRVHAAAGITSAAKLSRNVQDFTGDLPCRRVAAA